MHLHGELRGEALVGATCGIESRLPNHPQTMLCCLPRATSPQRPNTMHDLRKFEDAATTQAGLPPVHLWEPEYLGELDMQIAADGTWYYQGTPITRERLVRLFSTILRKDEDGRTYLVTPHEKYAISVEDAPFTAVEMEVTGGGGGAQNIILRTNTGGTCAIDREHPVRFEQIDRTGSVKPYVLVRGRLEALVNRSVFYDLVELGTVQRRDDADWFGLWSGGIFWSIALADEIGAEL